MSTPALLLRNLSKEFRAGGQTVNALSGLDLSVNAGEICAFLGPNGAGKTTTMHLIMDYIRPTTGSVEILGVDWQHSQSRSNVGFLPELFAFDMFLSGWEALVYYGKLSGVPETELHARTEKWLGRLGLWDARHRRLSTYSKGMVQRFGLAQALIGEPDLVMLDEPTSGMDPAGKLDVISLFRELRESGKTVFLSTHILADIENVADRVAMIDRGRMLWLGSMTELLGRGELSLVRFAATDSADVKASFPSAIFQDGAWQLEVKDAEMRRATVSKIADSGWELLALIPRRRGLDEAFLDVLKGGESNAAA